MADTSIAWTDSTWNPVRGCSRVSPGCGDATGGGCYAMKMAHRFSGPGMPYEGLTRIGKRGVDWAGFARLVPEQLDAPLRWRKPRRIFVNSMSDLFHESLTDEEILRVFDVMRQCPQHTFQVLTKRAARMRKWFSWVQAMPGWPLPLGRSGVWPLPNVWLGVSAEDQQRADERIPHLLATPAAVRFVSVEPQIGPVDLTRVRNAGEVFAPFNALRRWTSGEGDNSGIDWVICGGESGPHARPYDLAWARSLRDQCKASGTAFFFKQTGSAPQDTQTLTRFEAFDDEARRAYPNGAASMTVGWKPKDRAGADPADWPEDLRIREWPVPR